MTYKEYKWCFEKEKYETSILKWIYNSASGGALLIRTGNFINLAELLHYGNEICTCYDMYVLYISLPTFIHKKVHSFSQSANAQLTRNAKLLKYYETGRYGLRAPGRR